MFASISNVWKRYFFANPLTYKMELTNVWNVWILCNNHVCYLEEGMRVTEVDEKSLMIAAGDDSISLIRDYL